MLAMGVDLNMSIDIQGTARKTNCRALYKKCYLAAVHELSRDHLPHTTGISRYFPAHFLASKYQR
jgi:hypothetical protein